MKKNLFLIAVATAVVAACSSGLDETSVVESYPVRLCTDGLTGMTRAGQSVQLTQFDESENVSIFLVENVGGTQTPSGTNVTSYSNPLAYTTGESNALTPAAPQFWPQDGNGLFIFGVYPASAVTSSTAYNATGISFSVAADQSAEAGYKASDLMTGLPTAGNPRPRTSSDVPMTFTHLLTKIDVNLTAGNGFEDDDMDDAVISILGTKPTTTFDVQSTTVGTASGTAADIVAGTGAAKSAIIVPQAIAANASFLKVTVGGGDYIYKLPAATTFDAQTKYVFNITVNKTGLVLTTTQITAWEDGGAANGSATLQ